MKIDWGNSKYQDVKRMNVDYVVGTNTMGYFMVTTKSGGMFSKYKSHLELYSFEHEKEFDVTVDFEYEKHDLSNEGYLLTENNVLAFGSYYDKKLDKNILYGLAISFDGKITKNWTQVDEIISKQKRNAGNFSIVMSKDKKNVLVFHNEPYEKKENEKFRYKVMTSEFETIWEKSIELPFKDKDVFISGYTIDKDANVLMMARFDKDKKKKVKGLPSYTYRLLQYDHKKDKMVDHEISLGKLFISEITYTLSDDDKIIVAGFFSRKEGDFMTGTFYQRLNRTTMEVEKSGQKDFPKNFLNNFMSDRKIKKGKEIYAYDLRNLVLKEDGGAVLVAEQYYVHVVTNTSRGANGITITTTTYYYHYNDIIVVSINPDATIDWIKRIPKIQVSVNDGGYYSSFSLGVHEDKLYFLFNDNIKNFKNKKADKIYGMTNIKKAVVNLTTIDAKGNINSEILFSAKADAKNYLRPKFNYQYDKDKMLIYTRTKKQFKMGTVIMK